MEGGRLSRSDDAAVHADGLAVDPTGLLVDQEGDDAGDVFGLAETTERRDFGEMIHRLRHALSLRLMSMSLANIASSKSASAPTGMMPALLTTPSMPPSGGSRAVEHTGHLRRIGDIGLC